MSPCFPSKPTTECAECQRYRPEPMPPESRRRVVVIDASTVAERGSPCPMFAPDDADIPVTRRHLGQGEWQRTSCAALLAPATPFDGLFA